MSVTQSIHVDRYEIVIKKTVTRVVETKKRVTTDSRAYTDDEIAEANQWSKDRLKKGNKEIEGWSEPILDEKEETREVYRQTVTELDLPAVINAVNGIK